MYYIARTNNLSTPVDPTLDNLTYEAAMDWIQNVGNIVEYTIIQRN
jgi:hypothetical protein